MRIAAFDPGLSGAGVIYERDQADLFGRHGTPQPDIHRVVDFLDLPTAGENTQRRINAPAVAKWLLAHHPDQAVIESVTAMPPRPGPGGRQRSMGAASLGRFFRAVGAIEATVACVGVPHQYVTPQAWKAHHRLKGPKKEASRQRAIELVPSAAHLLTRKKDHGRAEALLMALWLADQIDSRILKNGRQIQALAGR
jgi:hypothetical protein